MPHPPEIPDKLELVPPGAADEMGINMQNSGKRENKGKRQKASQGQGVLPQVVFHHIHKRESMALF